MPTWKVDSETVLATSRSGNSVWEWPTIVACGMLLGFVAAINFGGSPAFGGVSNQLHRMFSRSGKAESEVRQALIVTADRRDQLTAVATLSPRGFYPLLAGNKREVMSQIRNHPGTLGLAVVDDTLPDYGSIAHVLNGALPAGSIIVLKGSDRSEGIGPIILDRLEVLKSKQFASEGEPYARRRSTRSAVLPAD
jgi:hypothetical protein